MTTLTSPAAADLLTWERQQSLRPKIPDVEEETSTAELTKAVAAKLRKKRKSSRPDSSAFTPPPTSFRNLSVTQKRRLLWQVKLALDQANSNLQSNDGEYPEDETLFTDSLLSGITAATFNDTTFTGYTNDTNFTGYTNDSPYSKSYETETVATSSTLSTFNTVELAHLESLLRKKDLDDLEVEEYLDTMGLGMCTLEKGLDVCCPWLFCGGLREEEEEIIGEDVNGEEEKRSGRGVEEDNEVSSQEKEEENANFLDDKKAEDEDIIDASWTLCGTNHAVLEEEEESQIDWNGGAAATLASKNSPSSAIGKKSFKQTSIASCEELKPMTVKQRLAQKMGFSIDATRDENVVFKDALDEDDESTQEDNNEDNAISKAEEAIRAMNLPTLTETQTAENEYAIPIDEEIIRGSYEVTSSESNSVPNTPSRAVIVQQDSTTPSTPSSMVQRSTKASQAKEVEDLPREESQEPQEEGIERGIDDPPPPIPSTPLTAVIPSIPLPSSTQSTPVSTENKSTASLAKQKFARAMLLLKKDKRVEDECAEVEGGSLPSDESKLPISTLADQPPSIPSTPLKAVIPSTPLPKSNPSTPLAAASVAAAVSTDLLTKEKLVSNADVDAVVAEEGIESSELLSESVPREQETGMSEQVRIKVSVPSTPLKAVPTTPLPNSAPTTPVAEDSKHGNVKQRLVRAMKLKGRPNVEKPSQVVEVDVNVNEDGVESVAPAITSRVTSSVISEEVIFTRDTHVDSPLFSSTSSIRKEGRVINVSDLMKSKTSSSPLAKIARVVKRKKNNETSEEEVRQVDVNVEEGGVEGSVVPAPPDESTAETKDAESAQVEDPTTPMLRLVKALSFHSQASASVEKKPESDAIVHVPPSMDDTEKQPNDAAVADNDQPPPVTSPVEVEKAVESSANPSTFSMMHVLAHAMSFMTEDNTAIDKSADLTPVDSKDAKKEPIDPAIAINTCDASDIVEDNDDTSPIAAAEQPNEATIKAPVEKAESEMLLSPFGMMQMLGQAMSFMTEDNNGKAKNSESKPNSSPREEANLCECAHPNNADDANNVKATVEETNHVESKDEVKAGVVDLVPVTASAVESAKETAAAGSAVNSAPADPQIDILREMSIATQRMNNKTTPVGLGNRVDETPDSIEFTNEMRIANQRANNKSSKFRNIGSKSLRMLSKAKSYRKQRTSANETKSLTSVSTAPSATSSVPVSVSLSDFTEKVRNTSNNGRRQKHWKEYTDPITGKKYYSNGITTTWTRPSTLAASNASADQAVALSPANEEKPGAKKGVLSKYLPNGTSTKENVAATESTSNVECVKKPELKLSSLLNSKSRKEKSGQPDESSVCTDNITADSEGNVSVLSSPSKSVIVDASESDNQDEVPKESEPEVESVPVCADGMATDSEGKVASTSLTLNTETGTAEQNVENAELTPKKKKKKRKKGWREYTCPTTGNKYYSNGTITTWDKPAEFDEARATKPQVESEKRVTMISFA